LLQAAPAGWGGALGVRQSPRARRAGGGEARPGWGGENAVCFAYPSAAQGHVTRAPWAGIFPGLAIFLAVLGFNLLGDALRDALEPRLRGARATARLLSR